MRILTVLGVLSANAFAQGFDFTPGNFLEKTVSLNYYNTEYIFINNNSETPLSLSFELLDSDFPSQWSVTGCTNMICYVKLPGSGTFGVVQPGAQAYFSINLAVNEIAGDGEIRYVVFEDENPQNRDTLLFIYHAAEDLTETEPQPWAKINFAQNVITVFLKNKSSETTLYVFDVSGNRVINLPLEEISSVSLSSLPVGIYIAVVRDANGKELIQKIVRL